MRNCRKVRKILCILIAIVAVIILVYELVSRILVYYVGRAEYGMPLGTTKIKGIIPLSVLETKIDQPQFCNGRDFDILICVKSSASNFERRRILRRTWASIYGKMLMNARVAFFIGKSFEKDSKLTEDVKVESRTYRDIVQGNFIDSYLNITLKSAFLLLWAKNNCQNAKFIMSCDDDTFIFPQNLVKALKPLHTTKNVLMGIKYEHTKPYRLSSSRYYASYEAYSGKYYPPFLTGSAYVMSFDVVHKLQHCTINTSMFHLDDVYITGICAHKYGIQLQSRSDFVQQLTFPSACFFKDIVTTADMPENQFLSAWHDTFEDYYYTPAWCLVSPRYIVWVLLLLTLLVVVSGIVVYINRKRLFYYGKFILNQFKIFFF